MPWLADVILPVPSEHLPFVWVCVQKFPFYKALIILSKAHPNDLLLTESSAKVSFLSKASFTNIEG